MVRPGVFKTSPYAKIKTNLQDSVFDLGECIHLNTILPCLLGFYLSLWLTYTLLLNPQMFLGYRRLICRKNRDIIKLQQTKWPQLPHRGHGSSTDKTVAFFFHCKRPISTNWHQNQKLVFPLSGLFLLSLSSTHHSCGARWCRLGWFPEITVQPTV